MAIERTTFQKVKLVVALILLVLTAIIVFQNLDSVQVYILFWEVNISLFVLALLNILIGFLLGWLFISRRHQKQNLMNTQKSISQGDTNQT